MKDPGENVLQFIESAPGRFMIDLRRYFGAYLRLLGALLVIEHALISLPFALLFDREPTPLPGARASGGAESRKYHARK